MYSLDVAILFHIDLICVEPHKLTRYSFEKKRNFSKKKFQNFQKIFFVKSRRIMLRKGDFQKSKIKFFFQKLQQNQEK